ncbi:MAG TPA: C25 family cysteine peptidase, partial [Candidatus Kapabacteria bacterium]|nr:C25 family cysteine peptidase [Candidatus Kapabacteria bacterium]
VSKTRINKPAQAPVIRSYASSASKPAIAVSSKNVGSKWTSTVKVDLGPAFVMPSDQRVVNSAGVSFSQVSWAKLTEADLPAGAAITNMGKPGEPAIPYLSFTGAVPAGATELTTRQRTARTSSIGHIKLVPLARMIDDTTSIRIYDAKTYQSAQLQPMKAVGPGRMRQLTMVQVIVPLIEFNAQGQSKALESFTIDLNYSAPSSSKSAFRDKHFTSVYQNLVLNSQDVQRFAGSFTAPRSKGASTQAFDESIISWIDQAAPYIKLTVKQDGLYRLTAAELSASGIDAASWSADQVRLIARGVEVPIWVEKDGSGKLTAIEFYGERLRWFGKEYYNPETDVNPYWLTTSSKTGGDPKRYAVRDVAVAPMTVEEGIVTLHHERDFDHYEGKDRRDDQETIFRTQWVDGERWIWKRLRPLESLRDTFIVSAMPANAQSKTIDVSYEVHGTSYDETMPDNHRMQVKLNDQVIDEQSFNAYDSLGRTVTVSAGILREGQNIIEIVSLGTTSTLDEVYVDRYRVQMPQTLAPNLDTAIARSQFDFIIPSQAGGYNVDPNTAEVTLYNLTEGVRLVGKSAAGSLVFPDVSTLDARYVGATAASFLKPAKLEAINKDGKAWSILDRSNGADYIVLTHPIFNDNNTGAQANKLKLRREAAGLRSKVVTTEEVFNAFSFGSDESWAIRRFIDYAYHNYAGTPPAFVTLFGDGTWDPKINRTVQALTSDPVTTHRTLVPTYGKPASDYIFTTVDGDGIDSLFPEVIISRIPAETAADGEAFVTKLVEYESRPPEAWNREFLFVIGGDGPPQKFEHYRFLEEVTIYTELPPGHSNYQGGLRFPPLNIVDTRVPRQVFNETDVTQVPRLQSEFREGKSLVHFAGHGATFITDVFFGDPGLYRNQGLYPLFITLSCRTGAFAEPYSITLNEAFLRTQGGGVVMAFGTTGFGEATYDFTLSSYLFKMFSADTLFQDTTYDAKRLNIASMLTVSKVLASIASFGNLAENARLQYSVLGDAAMGFVFRPQPEFHIEAADVKLRSVAGDERTVFEADESTFEAEIVVHNFGYSALNPVTIRVSDESSILLEVRDTLPFLHVTDTISLRLPLDTNRLGQHSLRITVDPDQEYSESNENDNEVSLSFIVNGQSGRPIFPFDASRGMCGINGDSVVIRMQVPEKKFVVGRDKLEIEFDTTARFTNPATSLSTSSGFPTITRSFLTSSLPRNYRNVVYWRTRTVINGVVSNWSSASFSIDKIDEPQLHISTRDQLEETIEVGLIVNAQDRLAIPQTDTVIYTVVSHGSADTTINSFSVSQIFRNDKPIYDLTHPKSGFALVVMTEDGNSIEQVHEFIGIPMDQDSIQQARAKEFDSIVKAIPDNRLAMVLTNFQPFVVPSFSLDKTFVQPALRSLGARIGFDSLDYFRSYAMIGRKGWTPGQAIENWDVARSDGSEVSYQVVTLGTSGIATTPFTGVASAYKRVRWTGPAIADGAAITFTLLGQRKDNNRIERLSSFQGASTYDQDISIIDASIYKSVAVEMEFTRNSNAATSPELASIAIEYTPAPELEMASLTANATSVE